jgi:hypothetical protein
MTPSSNTALGGRDIKELECLKHIIDIACTKTATDDISIVAMRKLTALSKVLDIGLPSARAAVEYATSIIVSLDPIKNRFRSRIQEIPEGFGKRSKAEMAAFHFEDFKAEEEGESKPQKKPEEGEPFVLANKLVKLIP